MPRAVQILKESVWHWDTFSIDGLGDRESAILTELVCNSKKLNIVDSVLWFHSYLPLDGDWKSYLANKTAKFRKTMRYTDNYLSRQGKISWTMVKKGKEVDEALQVFFDIDRQSWKADGGEVLDEEPTLMSYYQQLMREFVKIEGCGIFLLLLDKKPIAGVICLLMRNTLYALKTSFNDNYTQFSPGTVLFHHLIEESYKAGYDAIDFLGKIPFSERWTEQSQSFRRLLITNQNIYSRFLREIKNRKTSASPPGPTLFPDPEKQTLLNSPVEPSSKKELYTGIQR